MIKAFEFTFLLLPSHIETITELAAAVTNAGGLGVIGGVGYTPEFLRDAIKEVSRPRVNP